jgi:hypothetical protein
MEKDPEKLISSFRKKSAEILNSAGLLGLVLYLRLEENPWFPDIKNINLVDYEDRRHDRRVHFERDILYRVESGKDLKGRMINLSKGGLYIETDSPLKEGEGIQISFFKNRLSDFSCLPARVVRRGLTGMAVEFV